MNDVLLQIILAVVMFGTTAIAGLIPLKLFRVMNKKNDENKKMSSWIFTLLSCFGGGVFLGTCFLDIFPHVNANYEEFKRISGYRSSYPFPEFFACCGFFLVYFLEEISLKIFSAGGQGHSHGSPNLVAEQPLIATLPTANGHMKRSVDGGSLNSEKIKAVMTHEIVMDETVKYMSDDNKESGILKSITFAIIMSLHSILEGIALGVQDNRIGIITLFVSLIIHKGIEAFSVGLQITKSNSKRACMVTSTIIIYALMTPVGSMLGVMLTNLNLDPVLTVKGRNLKSGYEKSTSTV